MPASRSRDNAQRDKVLAILADRGAPVDAREVADALDIHVTTARFHLNKLVSDDAASTVELRSTTAGRPRIGYRAVSAPPVDDLIGHLLAQLGSTSAAREHAAADAGRVWADVNALSRLNPPSHADVALPDPITVAVETLTALGFRVSIVMSAFGTHELRICSCPLKDIGRHHPEVARGVARGVIEQTLASSSAALASQYLVDVVPDPAGDCEITLRLSRVRATEPAATDVTQR
ncbi:transcriptional regulator [Gordonia sp. ABSL49_1]|uniref:transcriptional regulator n=1 Tax=Gordonia sp. ABSL49_1 TaxID=2920941 RepID=UPI001F0FD6F1|nr:transcriptional regulator [Gordonia sp. ABSL49_1]MCH5644009.1 transcriptional regulator [Gordonia sp. ABSL49_1]